MSRLRSTPSSPFEPIPPQKSCPSYVNIEEWEVPNEAHLTLTIGILTGSFNMELSEFKHL